MSGTRHLRSDRLVVQLQPMCPGSDAAGSAARADLEKRVRDLEADFEQQQNDADFGEHGQHVVAAADPAEERRADDQTGDDLGNDRGQLDAFGDLGRDLRGDEHDEDVEEDGGDPSTRAGQHHRGPQDARPARAAGATVWSR